VGIVKRLYIIHGWAYSTEKWEALQSWLRAHDIEPVMLKVPGLTAPTDRPWEISNYVQWLEEQTHSETAPFYLLGHSNGGRIALNFATQHSNRLQHLVLVDSAGIFHNEPTLRLKRTVFGTAAKLGKRLTSSGGLRRLLYRVARARDYEEAPPHMRQTMINLQDSDQRLDVSRVSTPTTIIWGSADTLTPISDARALRAQLPQSTLHVIEGARHAPFFTHPEDVGKIVAGALN
jgi:3-oxoadipate enol-lactonase